ncbi:MAG: membrane protein insertase YidC [Candidatus Omnitrophota bacterium]
MMEKRFFLAFVVTLVFFVIYSQLVARFMPQPVPLQGDRKEYSREDQGSLQPGQISSQPSPLIIEEPAESIDFPQAVIGNFVITYSPLGGYIKSIAIGDQASELPFQNIGFLPQDQGKQFTANISDKGIEFIGPGDQRKAFVFEGYSLGITLNPPPVEPLVLFSNSLHPNMLDQRYQEIFYSRGQVIKRSSAQKMKDNTYSSVEFAGARDRYYCFSLLKGNYKFKWLKDKEKGHLYLFSPPEQILVYVGPQLNKELKPFGLEGVIYYGFFHAIGVGMIKLLYFFYFLTKNWGLSIVFFSVSVSLLLFPFTSKSTVAMRKMQQIQPEVEAIKAKYKDNPQKLQKETIELYRKYKINPLGGCLPLLFQLPVIMAFYQIIFRFVELRGAHFLWIKDLSQPDRFCKLPFPGPLGYLNLLPIFLVAIGLVQQKITTSSSAAPSQQKSMGLFFTVFIGVIFYTFPSALTLYWLIQNLFTLSHQAHLARNKT